MTGHRHRPVLAAGAPHGQGEVALALAAVARADDAQDVGVPVQELPGPLLAEHVVADLGVLAGQLAQLGDPVRIGQEPYVDHEVGVDRQPVLVTEGQHGGPELTPRLAAVAQERGLDRRTQLVHGAVAGVDHQVGLLAQAGQQPPLGTDAVDQPAAALQRVLAPHVLEPADEDVVTGLEEHHPRAHLPVGQLTDDASQILGEPAAAHVHDDGQPGDRALAAAAEVDERRDQFRRQVVDDVEPEVLEALGGRRASRAGQAGDDDGLERAGRLSHRRFHRC